MTIKNRISIIMNNLRKKRITNEQLNFRIDEILKSISDKDKKIEDYYELIRSIECKIDNLVNEIYFIKNQSSKLTYYNPELAKLKVINFPKVLICGFYGAPNLGDELMLETLLDYFKGNNNVSLTIMLANNPNYDIFKYDNVQFIHYPSTRFDYDILADYYDVIVFGGGALIDDADYNIQYNYNEMSMSTTLIELSKSAIMKGKKCYWIGLSSNNSFVNRDFINNLKFVIENNTNIYLRDSLSLKSLSDSKICVDNVNVINDIILANSLLQNIKPIGSKKNRIGIILVCSDHLVGDFNDYLLSSMIEIFSNKNEDYIISLIPFYTFNNHDIDYLKKLSKKYESYKKIFVTEFPKNFEETISIINSQDFIISMRYHGSLLAMALKKPLLSIILDNHKHYINKMNYLYSKYSSNNNYLYLSKINNRKLNFALNRLFNTKVEKFDDNIFKESQIELSNIVKTILD